MAEIEAVLIYEFGAFRVETLKRRLYRNGVPVSLSSKAFDALVMLINSPGETITRESLLDTVWADTAVEDNNLTQQISTLRRTLDESPGEHKFILTVPGKGYTFVSPVRRLSGNAAQEAVEPLPFRRSWHSGRPLNTGFVVAIWYVLLVLSPFLYSGVRYAVAGDQTQTLAVFQFRAATGDEFIGTGISETLRARLGSVADLTIRPTPNAIQGQDVLIAGRELKVDAVVTGSVQRADDRVRITVEMIDVIDGRIVWGKTFDDSVANIFALQDSIAGEVASALRVKLTSAISPVRFPVNLIQAS